MKQGTLNFILLLFIISCGKENKTSLQKNIDSTTLIEAKEGIYKAIFLPLNSSVAGLSSGLAYLKLFNKNFEIKLNMLDLPVTNHAQYLYEGDRCPDLKDDLNQDGYLDAKEGEEVYGKAIIPLDSDLSQQFEEMTVFPTSDRLGNYHYEQASDWQAILNDLALQDENKRDHIKKTNEFRELNNKVIVIHGIDSSVFLPSTVEGFAEGDVRGSLPIACAKINWISKNEADSNN